MRWAVNSKLHDNLFGVMFEVHRDNNPLTYELSTAKLDAAGYRWLAELSTYDFSLKYRHGKLNIDADALSRPPPADETASYGEGIMHSGVVQAVCHTAGIQAWGSLNSRAIDLNGSSNYAVPRAYCSLSHLNCEALPYLTSTDLSQAQQRDICIGELWYAFTQHDVT